MKQANVDIGMLGIEWKKIESFEEEIEVEIGREEEIIEQATNGVDKEKWPLSPHPHLHSLVGNFIFYLPLSSTSSNTFDDFD